jgi:DNA-binding transcriptional MerR regulator
MKGTVAFTLNSERDQDIIKWLRDQGNRSAAIREAIRCYMGQPGLQDVYNLLLEIKESGAVIQAVGADDSEPDDLSAALDRLGR